MASETTCQCGRYEQPYPNGDYEPVPCPVHTERYAVVPPASDATGPAPAITDETALLASIQDALCDGGEEMYEVHVTHSDVAERAIAGVRQWLAGRTVVEPGSGVARIAAERRRHVEVEGWTPEHDAEHGNGQLATAAACYALPDRQRGMRAWSALGGVGDRSDRIVWVPVDWPWPGDNWKPGDRIRELEKAGALIAAEIDRLASESSGDGGRS